MNSPLPADNHGASFSKGAETGATGSRRIPHDWTPSQFTSDDARRRKSAAVSEKEATPLDNVFEPIDAKRKPAKKGKVAKPIREYSNGEEIANSVTHGIGALLAIASIPVCIVIAVSHGGGLHLLAALVYTITMLLEYVMSTLYHALTGIKAKRVFKVLDHSCIYLFIAGSYAPFCLVSLIDYGGFFLFLAVWALALIGVACEAFWTYRPRWISAVLYLLLGWCVVWFLPPLIEVLPAAGVWLLVGGGICYSVGCIFYVLKKIPYMHSIFHVWVLAGSICQFLAIALYVL